jgi:hypothetical protein
MFNREGFSGTSSSITMDSVFYLYVDRDCTVKGEYMGRDYADSLLVTAGYKGYTYNAFELRLKKGWNTICETQTHTSSGESVISLSLRNPNNNKWVLLNDPYIPSDFFTP